MHVLIATEEVGYNVTIVTEQEKKNVLIAMEQEIKSAGIAMVVGMRTAVHVAETGRTYGATCAIIAVVRAVKDAMTVMEAVMNIAFAVMEVEKETVGRVTA